MSATDCTACGGLGVDLDSSPCGACTPPPTGSVSTDTTPDARTPAVEVGPDHGDVANARRFIESHGDRFRYHARARRWLTYSAGVWLEDPDRIGARRAAEEVARDMLRAAADAPDRSAADELAKEARKTMQARRLDAMLDVAEPHLAVDTDELDADPWLLNVSNGVVDLRTGELAPHDPGWLLTRQATAAYLPDAEAPSWARFLEKVLPDPEVRTFVQRVAGLSLVGAQRDHLLPIAYGVGANGKSTFYGAVGRALGTYAGKVAVTMLVGRGADRTGATPELLALRGVRFVVADEPEAGSRLREAHIKALTGGDRIVARPLYGDPVEFEPSHTLTLVTNHRPQVDGNDHGIWRRLLLVPWSVTVPAEDQDHDLPAKLDAEAAGILRWAVEGCLLWQQSGLAPPEPVKEATAAYRSEQDHLAAFIEDACIVSASVSAPAGPLYEAYAQWCADAGIEAMTATAFGSTLTDKGFPRGKSGNVRSRRGIALQAGI